MAQTNLLLRAISSPDEFNNVLKTLIRPIGEQQLNKQAFINLWSGLRVIVQSWQRNEHEISHQSALEWFRFILDMPKLISSSNIKMKFYLSYVPSAITYIIGSLRHATNNEDFYKEALKIACELVKLLDKDNLKKFENSAKGMTPHLWNIIDRVGDFQTQMQVLELLVLILKDLDKDFVFDEVKSSQNSNSDEITYTLLDLLRMRTIEDNLFKKSVRNILNKHNSLRREDAQVQSFYCKTMEIGETMKFIKPTYMNRFWFDINENLRTLTFEGRIAPKNSRKYQDLNVSLQIIEMFQCNNFLNIMFNPPAKFTGIQKASEFNEVNIARIALCKTEQKRFLNIFNVPVRTETSLTNVESEQHSTPCESFNMSTNQSHSAKQTKLNISSGNLGGKRLSKACQKQIQQVNPLPKKTTTQPLDEYDFIDVSDVAPCQSYRNFKIQKSASNLSRQQLKRPMIVGYSDLQMDYGPSTSKNANLRQYDQLKTDNSWRLCKDKTIDLTENSLATSFSHSRDERQIKNPVEVASGCENPKNSLNLKTPESKKKHFEMPLSETKELQTTTTTTQSSLMNYKPQMPPLHCEENRNDGLIYHTRSDSDSNSEINFDSRSSRKRKSKSIHKSPAKKSLFTINRDSMDSDSDSDCEFTEIVFLAQKDFRPKMHKMSSSLSSFFQKMFPQQVANNRKRRNVYFFEDLESLYKYIQP